MGLAEDGPCRMKPMVAVPHLDGNHYCVLVMNADKGTIHVLGRHYRRTSQMRCSLLEGEEYVQGVWKRVSMCHGQEAGEMDVYEMNWMQNGRDCGAIACLVIERIWGHGMEVCPVTGHWEIGRLSCSHGMRMRMAGDIVEFARRGAANFRMLRSRVREEEAERVLFEGVDEYEERVLRWEEELKGSCPGGFGRVKRSLVQGMEKCWTCRGDKVVGEGGGSRVKPGDIEKARERRVEMIEEENGAQVVEVGDDSSLEDRGGLKGWRGSRGVEGYEGVEGSEEGWGNDSVIKGKGGSGREEWRGEKEDGRVEGGVRVGKGRVEVGKKGRIGRAVGGLELPEKKSVRGGRQGFDMFYDEYMSGPTLEVLRPLPERVEAFAEVNMAYVLDRTVYTPWRLMQDYGYRIMPGFYEMLQVGKPEMVMEHLLPVGEKGLGGGAGVVGGIVGEGGGRRRRREVMGNDMVVMGASEMISMASRVRSNLLFVTGKTVGSVPWEEPKLIVVDLERDGVEPDRIIRTVDVDSAIWVTRCPSFRLALQVFMRPVIRNRAPIWKHNHVYVDLLLPQSEEDREKGGMRQEWWEKRFKLHQIPHVHLGKVGDGAGTANVYMFFPRMTHRHPHVGRYMNIVPGETQNELWDKVIIPGLRRVTGGMERAFVGLTREHLGFKEGRGWGGGKKSPTYPLRRETWLKLREDIREIVSGVFKIFIYWKQ